MHFMVLAYDGTDEGAKGRRDAARPDHAASIKALYEAGRVILGAGIRDDNGNIIGSLVVTDHESRDDVDAYVANEPFTTARVWERVEIHPIGVGDIYLQK